MINLLFDETLIEDSEGIQKFRDRDFIHINGYVKKPFTKRSVIGQYVQNYYSKHKLSVFEDSINLWTRFEQFRDSCESRYYESHRRMRKLSHGSPFIFSQTSPNSDDGDSIDFISHLQTLAKGVTSRQDQPVILLSTEYFQHILNWCIYMCFYDVADPNYEHILEMLNKVSLADVTRFPSLHILHYLQAMKSRYYQDALDSLHSYYDYMLTGNSNKCFHMSLLSLATFHSSFHDCDAAIRSFEEATKSARENKDSRTLNLIMIWMVAFIERYPENASKFQVTIDQIIEYLKKHSDSENILVFESAYKFESMTSLMNNDNVMTVLYSSLKHMIITLQHGRSRSIMVNMLKYRKNLWDSLGYGSVGDLYSPFLEKHAQEVIPFIRRSISMDDKIRNDKYKSLYEIVTGLKNPSLQYQESMELKLLEIRRLISCGDSRAAMERIAERIKECDDKYSDKRWKFEFQKEKCQVFLHSGKGIRCMPVLKNMIDESHLTYNQLQSMESLVILLKLLIQINKREEALSCMNLNLTALLQFPILRGTVLELFQQLM